MAHRDRQPGGRLYRGSRQFRGSVPPAFPLGLRDSPVPVEASAGSRPLRLLRERDAALAGAVPGGLSDTVTAHRSANSVDSRQRPRYLVVARIADTRLAALAASDGVALRHRLHV